MGRMGPDGVGVGDGKGCSQSWVMWSDDHGMSWNYSRTLLLVGDESQAAQLPNGSVVINMRAHDLNSYDHGDPDRAIRWIGRSDDYGTTWPAEQMWPLVDAQTGANLTFGGDCEGTMVSMPGAGSGAGLLVMAAVHCSNAKDPACYAKSSGGDRASLGDSRRDLRVHTSTDGGRSWTYLTTVYTGFAA